jgi:predicted N-acetyltransferase YhbS
MPMSSGLTASPDFTIRSLETPEEYESYFHMNAQIFRPDEDAAIVAARRRRFIMGDPDFQASSLHGAFLGEVHVGSYRMQERWLYTGSSRVRVGCIGGVVTRPEYRHQGIASALMLDALTFARQHHYGLLLLHGIADFYQQLGYVDVFEDLPNHTLERARIPEQPPEGYTVRPVTPGDAPAVLALYQEHYSGSIGSFAPARTVMRQAHYLQYWPEENTPLLALNVENKPEGYLWLSRRRGRLYAYEVAADTWPATLALLQYHSRLLDAEAEPPPELWWPLPLADLTLHLLTDHFPLRSDMDSYPDGGWMAQMISLPLLAQALLPLWNERWQQRRQGWVGRFALTVSDYTIYLELLPDDIQIVESLSDPAQQVNLSQQVFMQLFFGFRSITWAALQLGQSIPVELIPVLNVLFPLGQVWIAGSDRF